MKRNERLQLESCVCVSLLHLLRLFEFDIEMSMENAINDNKHYYLYSYLFCEL